MAPAARLTAVRAFASRHALALIIALGAVLRFATLGIPSLWLDEYLTVFRIRRGFVDMLEATSDGATPPLYFMLAWGWQKVFGTGEVVLRSLSAVLGTGAIPVIYAAARMLASRRAGLMAAALAATSPLLIWYSQEVRTYPLLILLSAFSLLFFAYALQRSEPRWVWAWALASGLALTTHYFALALIVPEAIWLLYRARTSRLDVLLSGAAVGVVGVGLLPLWAQQRSGVGWIASLDRSDRLLAVPQHFAIGLSTPGKAVPLVVIAMIVAAVIFALSRADRPSRRAFALTLAIGLAGMFIAVVAALVGSDYILTKNLIELWLPFGIAVSIPLAARRVGVLGPAVMVALCAIGIALYTWTAATPAAQRMNWGDVADALGAPREKRVVAAPGMYTGIPLSLYLDRSRLVRPGAKIVASELVLVWVRPVPDYGIGPCFWGAKCGGDGLGGARPPFQAPPEFRLVRQGSTDRAIYRIYRAPRPERLPAPKGAQIILVQQPG